MDSVSRCVVEPSDNIVYLCSNSDAECKKCSDCEYCIHCSVERGNYLVDREHLYTSILNNADTRVYGYRVFDKNTLLFQGLLSTDNVALWYVREDMLRECDESEVM